MTNSEHFPDNIDRQFEAIMGSMAIYSDGSHYYMPLDEEKETIIQASLDQIQVLEDELNSNDPKILGAALIQANIRLNSHLLQTEGLRRDDEIVADGEGIVLLVDRDSSNGSADIHPLSATIRIRGMVNNAAIGMVPPVERLAAILSAKDGEELPDDLSTESYVGVHLHIRECVFESDGYEDWPVPENMEVLLPLNCPGLKLNRVIRQATE